MEKKNNKNKTTEVKKIRKPAAKKPVFKKQAVKKNKGFAKQPEAGHSNSYGLFNLIVPKGSHKRKKLLGRGSSSGHGKTSTRGSKGQTSRAGRHFYLGLEGGQTPLIRRIPKRGFSPRHKHDFQIVNLKDLERIKETSIGPELLALKGLIKKKDKLVKILGEGEIKSPLVIKAHAFSKKAADKVKAAGGTVELINA